MTEEVIQEEPPEPTGVVADANKAAERLEAANATALKLIQREEALRVEATLSGSAVAGKTVEVEEETDRDYALKILAGNK